MHLFHPLGPSARLQIYLSLSLICTQVSCVVFPFPSLSIFSPSHPASALLRRRSHTSTTFFSYSTCTCVRVYKQQQQQLLLLGAAGWIPFDVYISPQCTGEEFLLGLYPFLSFSLSLPNAIFHMGTRPHYELHTIEVCIYYYSKWSRATSRLCVASCSPAGLFRLFFLRL